MRLKGFLALPARCLCLAAGIFTCLLFFTALPASAQSVAYVRIIHASPYVGTADIFVDGTKMLSSFQFGAVTDYVQIPAGPHTVQIAVVGKGINASALTQKITVTAGVAYTVAALGTSPTGLSLATFVDDNQVATGMARVRIYHLAPDAASAQIAVGEDATVSGVPYGQASQYLTLSTGPCTFKLSTPANGTATTLTTTLVTNTVTSVFAVGMLKGAPAIRLVSAQATGIPGMPGTGSDPQITKASTTQPFPLWLVGGLAAAVIGLSLFTRYRSLKR